MGPQIQSRDGVPRWDGAVHPILGQGRDSRLQVEVTDREPRGPWTLAIVSDNPGELPFNRFTACGPERTGDPGPLVERLHAERTEGPLRAASVSLGRRLPEEIAADGTAYRPLDARESLDGPDGWGRWQYAAVWTDPDAPDTLRYTPLGEPVSTRGMLPVLPGGQHTVVPTPEGLDPETTPKQLAFSTDREPPGEWVLGVVTTEGGVIPPRRFLVAGEPRSEDPRSFVAGLQARSLDQSGLTSTARHGLDGVTPASRMVAPPGATPPSGRPGHPGTTAGPRSNDPQIR